MPRPLFYVLLATLVVFWLRRFVRPGTGTNARRGYSSGGRARGRVPPGAMPEQLVCGACGAQYDPQATGWICPKCHK